MSYVSSENQKEELEALQKRVKELEQERSGDKERIGMYHELLTETSTD
jgi:hypothetical protein